MTHPPDILWIVTTQWRAQALGYAGDVNALTPQLDALAAESVAYPQAVTPHPFGPFARAALLTGLPSPANGVRGYFDPLPETARTIAHELNDRGYTTGYFGKWHLGRRSPGAALVGEEHAKTIVPPDARGGFEHWEGFESGFLLNDPWLHGTGFESPAKFTGYQSEVVCGRAEAWLARAGATDAELDSKTSRPWFCVVSLEPPHPPYHAPAAGVRPRTPQELTLNDNVPRGGEVETKARSELAGYYAHIEATDRAIGRLVRAVDAAQALRGRPRPIVVFTSVHGDMHGAHGLFRKGWPHEESIRIPLLVRPSPGEASLPMINSELVSLVDLPRWTLAWTENDFRSVKPALEFQRISMPSVVALPQQCDREWRGVRTRTRKLVLNADGSPWLFFDLANDPFELRNLAGYPAWLEEIERLRGSV